MAMALKYPPDPTSFVDDGLFFIVRLWQDHPVKLEALSQSQIDQIWRIINNEPKKSKISAKTGR